MDNTGPSNLWETYSTRQEDASKMLTPPTIVHKEDNASDISDPLDHALAQLEADHQVRYCLFTKELLLWAKFFHIDPRVLSGRIRASWALQCGMPLSKQDDRYVMHLQLQCDSQY